MDNTESTEKVEDGGILPTPEVDNVFGGSNRYETSVDVSINGWERADNVVLVSGTAIADGIAAAPLAGIKDAPILLTQKESIPQSVKDELKRLETKNVYVIGGEAVISKSVDQELNSLGITVQRIARKYKSPLVIVLDDISKEQEDVLKKDGEAQVYQVGLGIANSIIEKITELLTRK